MGIIGSVQVQPTVSSNTETSETATFPEANLTVVKIVHAANYLKIPIDSSRFAYIPSAGGAIGGSSTVATIENGRNVTFTINGTALTYSVHSVGTTPNIIFYYGSALPNSQPLTAFAGIVTAVTLSSGSGSGTFTFPSGGLKMTGLTATFGLAAASTALLISWNTSSGQSLTAFVYQGTVTQSPSNEDIFRVDLPVQQTVNFTLSGGVGSDKTLIYAFYR